MNIRRPVDSLAAKAVVTVHEAKTHLSRLLSRVEAGEQIVVARGTTPVAMIVPLPSPTPKRRQLGWLAHEVPEGMGDILSHGFWDPLSDEEMGLGPDELLDR